MKEKPTRRQRANLLRLTKAHKRQLGDGTIKLRKLKILRGQLEGLVRVKSLQKRRAERKKREKELKERVVRVKA